MSMIFMGLCYLIVWISFVGGYWWICQKNENSIKFEKYLWNARIDKMQYPPFSIIMRLSERRNPLILFLVIIINSIMVITEFILGLIFLGPIMLIIQGFMVGALIAQADVKTKIFSLFVLLFELGSFSAASGLGLYAVIQKIFVGIPIIESIATLSSNGYLWIPVILLILNGVFEGSGVIFNIEGVPGIKAVREKLYK
ncbi:MAG TPA: hypothetical protein VJL59_04665 [Anaerolineales bacterium]|nr:hypothetical protein [Anaerolineales bacterium]